MAEEKDDTIGRKSPSMIDTELQEKLDRAKGRGRITAGELVELDLEDSEPVLVDVEGLSEFRNPPSYPDWVEDSDRERYDELWLRYNANIGSEGKFIRSFHWYTGEKPGVDSVDLALVKDEEAESVVRLLKIIERYLYLPAIKDNFVSHDSRREWRRGMPGELHKFMVTHNRLNGRGMTLVLDGIQAVAQCCKSEEVSSKLVYLRRGALVSKRGSDASYKLTDADRVSIAAREVLDLFQMSERISG